ncbi:MAG: virulence associated protein [Proteobacteria bacterium]|nr:virulence associated protein [Pseudomonadota bacterium]
MILYVYMPLTNSHLNWLKDTGKLIKTNCGKEAKIFCFDYDANNTVVMSAWAKHFRSHYCLEKDLKVLKPEEMKNSDYFLKLKFPDEKRTPGPSIRAGDFAEILIADYLEYLHAYYVPRTRYDRKIIRNESSKGCDVLAFKQGNIKPNWDDELLIYEVKAALSDKKPINVLQDAIDHSSKDELRIAESLNAVKQRLYDKQDISGIATVERFQSNIAHPYKRIYGAAAVIAEKTFCVKTLKEADSTNHVSSENLELLVISGKSLMSLVHELYKRAADEA